MHLARTSDGRGTGTEGLMAGFAILLDEGRYQGSVRTMYRLLGRERPVRRTSTPTGFDANTFDILRGSSAKQSHTPAASELCE